MVWSLSMGARVTIPEDSAALLAPEVQIPGSARRAALAAVTSTVPPYRLPTMSRFFRFLPVLALTLPLGACDSDDPDGTIRRVLITEIAIDDAPLLRPDGDSWDSGSGIGLGDEPDLYVELVNDDSGSIVESFRDENFSNVDERDFPLVYDLGEFPIEFSRFNTALAFDLYDEDPQLTKGEDDFVGSTGAFNIQDLIDGGRPNFLRLSSDDGEITVSVRFVYE